MDKFEWILIAGVSLSILLLILTLTSLYQYIFTRKTIKKMNANKPRDRKKRKRWKKELRQSENKKNKKMRVFLFSLLATLLVGGGTGYAKFYVATNLNEEDTENIVYGYYLLNQIEEQVKEADGEKDLLKTSRNIHTLSISLASFSSKKGNNRSVEEAQILLNQYYAKIGQFGLNVSNQDMTKDLKDKEKKQDILNDIKIVKQTQKKVIDYYKIDEASLEQKK